MCTFQFDLSNGVKSTYRQVVKESSMSIKGYPYVPLLISVSKPSSGNHEMLERSNDIKTLINLGLDVVDAHHELYSPYHEYGLLIRSEKVWNKLVNYLTSGGYDEE